MPSFVVAKSPEDELLPSEIFRAKFFDPNMTSVSENFVFFFSQTLDFFILDPSKACASAGRTLANILSGRFLFGKIFSRPKDEIDATDRKPGQRGATFKKESISKMSEKSEKTYCAKKTNCSLLEQDFAKAPMVSEF